MLQKPSISDKCMYVYFSFLYIDFVFLFPKLHIHIDEPIHF